MAQNSKKTFTSLGYSHLDTAEIVTLLNRFLANYAVHQQKLRNFQWNLSGQDFFDLKERFGSMYDRSEKEIDDVAWRIRLFGQVPFSNFSDYLKHSSVKEAKGNLTSYEMAKEVLADIRILLEILEQGILAATEINDKGSELLL